jgi:hypothetical protein
MPHSLFLILWLCSSTRLALAIKVKFGFAQWQLMGGHFNTVTVKYWPICA